MIKYTGFEHFLEESNKARPDAVLFVYEKDGSIHSSTVSHFYSDVLHRAADFKLMGKKCAAFICDGSYPSVVAIFASVLSGMQTVLLDEHAPASLLELQLEETDAEMLLGDAELAEELRPFLRTDASPGISEAKPHQILFFTSGTTSQVKAVILTDQSLMASAWNGSTLLPLDESDTLLNLLPMNHVFGFVCGMLWGLQCGARVALGRGPRHSLEDLSYFRPTVISAVPLLLSFLTKFNVLNEELRLILIGAGSCPPELFDSVTAMGIRVAYGYGLTETSSGVALSTEGDPNAMRTCPDVTISLSDDGEILIEAGDLMMTGYYKRPEDTAAALIGDILITGDLGRLDEEGKLYITGRKKEILLLADGTKIFLPEYEMKLQTVLPDREYAVIEYSQVPVLIIRGQSEERPAILEALKKVMADYPRGQQLRGIYFTKRPLPRTATGKVQRWILENRMKEGPDAL